MKFLEKLGVPDNLIEVSKDIHKKILNSLKSINHPLIEGNILIGKYDTIFIKGVLKSLYIL
jgi:flavoprotein